MPVYTYLHSGDNVRGEIAFFVSLIEMSTGHENEVLRMLSVVFIKFAEEGKNWARGKERKKKKKRWNSRRGTRNLSDLRSIPFPRFWWLRRSIAHFPWKSLLQERTLFIRHHFILKGKPYRVFLFYTFQVLTKESLVGLHSFQERDKCHIITISLCKRSIGCHYRSKKMLFACLLRAYAWFPFRSNY